MPPVGISQPGENRSSLQAGQFPTASGERSGVAGGSSERRRENSSETARIPSSQAARKRARNRGDALVVPERPLSVPEGRRMPPPSPERLGERNIYGLALRVPRFRLQKPLRRPGRSSPAGGGTSPGRDWHRWRRGISLRRGGRRDYRFRESIRPPGGGFPGRPPTAGRTGKIPLRYPGKCAPRNRRSRSGPTAPRGCPPRPAVDGLPS